MRIGKEFKLYKVRKRFKKTLREDMKKVQTSKKKTLSPVDRALKMYRLNKGDYQNLLGNIITTTYKKN